MTRLPRSLAVKLFVAHLLVIVVGIVVLYVTATTAAPRILDLHLLMMGDGHQMAPSMRPLPGGPIDEVLARSFGAALNQALLTASLAAVAVALAASVVAARLVAGPVHQLVLAARRVAAGSYRERVPTNGTTELDALAHSFNEMAAALEDSEQRRLQLIGDVAHELRTPISTFQGYLEGLADGVVEPNEEVWALLLDQTGRMQRLVEDMHELSRAEAGQLRLELAPVPPGTIVEAAVVGLRPEFAARGLHLSVAVAPDLPSVGTDRDRAIQVLTNVLSNALRYTSAPGEVEVSAARDGDAVRFTVRDTGIGLAPEHLPHVFERFYRADSSRSRALGGSGVGLSIARALVEDMGGRIWAVSPGPDQGATFAFTLPVA